MAKNDTFVGLPDLRENLRVVITSPVSGDEYVGTVREYVPPQFRVYWDDGIVTNYHTQDLACLHLRAVRELPKELPKKVLTKQEIYAILLQSNDFTVQLATIRKIEKAVIAKYSAMLEEGA